MTEFLWSEVRERAVREFGGQTPVGWVEAEIVAVFEQDPLVVVDAIPKMAARLANGQIQSAWAVLRKHVTEELETRERLRHVVAVDDPDRREKAERGAENWVRNTGVYFDSGGEVEDELFGPFGRLRQWAGDEVLRRRMLDLWRPLRPAGARAEREQLERAEQWKQSRQAVLVEIKRQQEGAWRFNR